VEIKAILSRRRFSASLSFAILDAKTQLKATIVITPMISTIVHLVHVASVTGACENPQNVGLAHFRPQSDRTDPEVERRSPGEQTAE
jgi:hypothetical protein